MNNTDATVQEFLHKSKIMSLKSVGLEEGVEIKDYGFKISIQ